MPLNVDNLTPEQMRAIAAAAIAYVEESENEWRSPGRLYRLLTALQVACRLVHTEAHDAAKKD